MGIPTPLWVRPPFGFTFYGPFPQPVPNIVKDSYNRVNLYLGPIHSDGYADGNNWTVDSRDSVPLSPPDVIQQLQDQITLKVNAPFDHRKLIILFHDINVNTPVGNNLNDYLVAIDETLRGLNMAPQYVTLPDPPFPEAIQD